jgi:hypothetical protein
MNNPSQKALRLKVRRIAGLPRAFSAYNPKGGKEREGEKGSRREVADAAQHATGDQDIVFREL